MGMPQRESFDHRVVSLESEIERLIQENQHLRQFARHVPTCRALALTTGDGEIFRQKCDCGLEKR